MYQHAKILDAKESIKKAALLGVGVLPGLAEHLPVVHVCPVSFVGEVLSPLPYPQCKQEVWNGHSFLDAVFLLANNVV